MKNINLRIDNLELRKTKSFNDKEYYEIVKWYPNEDLGKQDSYKWDDKRNMYYNEINRVRCYVTKERFTIPEFCFTIAIVKESSEEPDIRSVGSRMTDITDEEWVDFKKIIEFYYNNYLA